MSKEFWVVGGQYQDVTFAVLDESGREIHGPFVTYDHALHCWRERTSATRSYATTRFTVVSNAVNSPK